MRGLLYTVESLLELWSAGMSIDEVLENYPTSSVTICSRHWSSARWR
ncbi:DUF433 domain-containing protein [Pseudonocardia ailaonensis]